MKLRVRPADFLALLLSLGVVAASVVYTWGGAASAEELLLSTDGVDYLYPLGVDGHYRVSGPEGESVIEIHDHRARVLSSPCRDQICVNAGWLDAVGEWTACLPNHFLIRIQGNVRDAEFDASAY